MRKALGTEPNVIIGWSEGEVDALKKSVATLKDQGGNRLEKSLVNQLDSHDPHGAQVYALAFETDPSNRHHQGTYIPKIRGVPDNVSKRIAAQESLVADIVRTRQSHVSRFGRRRADRFDYGFTFEADPQFLTQLDDEQKRALQDRIAAAEKRLERCGAESDGDVLHTTFSEWLETTCRNAVVNGRIAAHHAYAGEGPDRKWHHFDWVDGGTIFRGTNQSEAEARIRDEAYKLLTEMRRKGIGVTTKDDPPKEDPPPPGTYFPWVQVFNGRVHQAFTPHELSVKNFYPVPDYESDGYPVTPIDTCWAHIMTRLSITTHNRLFFESGRAARGILVVTSDDVSQQQISNIKQQFNASINGASNCVDGRTRIWTREYGAAEIQAVAAGADEVAVTVWTGTSWQPAVVYPTGRKRLVTMGLGNGVVTRTSPDHRFMTVGTDGAPVWVRQESLRVGDLVAVNKVAPETGTSVHPAFSWANFLLAAVVSIDLGCETEMYDVAVREPEHDCAGADCLDISHSFVADGALSHNSWRMPVFGVRPETQIAFQSIDAPGRDAEFQYLMDSNSREILAAFQIAPEELTGFAYLSKGTNSQSLSESKNEMVLEAARDVGIRPLLAKFEDFINQEIFPRLDPELARITKFRFKGLDEDSPEKEAERTAADQQNWMTMDDVLQRVGKDPIGKRWGGAMPFNPLFQQVIGMWLTMGEIRYRFITGNEADLRDPSLAFYPTNAGWLQWQQLQAQAQAAAQAPPPDEEKSETAAEPDPAAPMNGHIDKALATLQKSVHALLPHQRRLLDQQDQVVRHLIRGFVGDAEDAAAEIVRVAKAHVKPGA